ncbi:MAG: DUF1360 domain-containing protein [Actinomycetota bacterium]|nr:DUF1360 domain-containing protein [Actinomycetota bacterium]
MQASPDHDTTLTAPSRPDPSAADATDGDRPAKNPHDPERLAGYRAVAAVYLSGALVAGIGLARRRATEPRPSLAREWGDVALVSLATFKASRLLTKQTVTSPLRAPFTEFTGHGGPGEVNVRPTGDGWRRSVGELLSCPFCLDVWLASGSTVALRLAPGPTRVALSTLASVGLADMLHFVYVGLEHRAED